MKKEGAEKKKKRTVFGFILRLFFLIVLLIFLIAAVGGLFLWHKYSSSLEKWENMARAAAESSEKEDFLPEKKGHIYDKDGNILIELSKDKKRFIWNDDIPRNVKNAFIAIEDRSFYENAGYDTKGMFRVALRYILTKGKEKHGASTITQQLVKNTYLSSEVSMERKVREILTARELAKKYTKDEIITYYCNTVCFANNIYGIEEAAKEYFGKTAKDLTLSETAYLCAIPNSPSRYDPWKDKNAAIDRRDKILSDMTECGFITEAERDQAINESINILEKISLPKDPDDYLTNFAIRSGVYELMREDNYAFRYDFSFENDYQGYLKQFGEDYKKYQDKLYSGGYEIKTSLDRNMSNILQEEIVSGLPNEVIEGSAVVIDNETGKVVAISGGREGQGYNRAALSTRQPGSSIKPLIAYLPALEKGWSMTSKVKSISVKDANKGKIVPVKTLRIEEALMKSDNGTAMYLLDNVGINIGLGKLKSLEFESIVPDDEHLAAALGGLTHGTNTLEMAAGYASIVSGGIYRGQTCIVSINDKDIEPISKKIYDEDKCKQIIPGMQNVIAKGTAKSMNWSSSIPAAGKTGTTNDNKDGWFCGFTPYYTLAVWVGYDQPKKVNGLVGGTYPARIWKGIMTRIIDGLPQKEFDTVTSQGDGTKIETDSDTGLITDRPGNKELSPGYTVDDYNSDMKLLQKVKEDTEHASEYIDQIYGNKIKSQAKAYVKQQ